MTLAGRSCLSLLCQWHGSWMPSFVSVVARAKGLSISRLSFRSFRLSWVSKQFVWLKKARRLHIRTRSIVFTLLLHIRRVYDASKDVVTSCRLLPFLKDPRFASRTSVFTMSSFVASPACFVGFLLRSLQEAWAFHTLGVVVHHEGVGGAVPSVSTSCGRGWERPLEGCHPLVYTPE